MKLFFPFASEVLESTHPYWFLLKLKSKQENQVMYMKNPTYLYLGLWRKTDKLDFHAPWLDLSLGVSILKLNQFQKFPSNCPCLYHCKLSISIWRCDRCHCLWLELEPQVYLKSKIILRNANIIIITCSWRFFTNSKSIFFSW